MFVWGSIGSRAAVSTARVRASSPEREGCEMTPEQAMKIQEARMKADDRRHNRGMVGAALLLAVLVAVFAWVDAGGLLVGGMAGFVLGVGLGTLRSFGRADEEAGDWQRAQQAEAAD